MTTKFHKEQFELFNSMRDRDELAHAYLLTGPRGVGKLDFARQVAAWLQTPATTGTPDFPVVANNHPDIIETPVPLPIKEAVDLKKSLSTAPYSGNYNIVIINSAEKMHIDAANSLLKWIEEPKGDVIFFLITEYADNMLETVRSRCYEIKFPLVSDGNIEKALNTDKIKDLKAHWSGRPALAARLLNDEDYRDKISGYKKDYDKFLVGTLGAKFAISEKYAKIKDSDFDVLEVLRVWIEHEKERDAKREDVVLSGLLMIYKNTSTTNANFKFALNNLAVKLQ
ncbi:MAG: AAA family ATPase [Candidatus Spechtbacterales bacterium]